MFNKLPSNSEYLSALKSASLYSSKNDLGQEEADTPLPENLQEWLARLALLYGVPFEHLVPNPAMLPIESLRFFYMDPNWTSILVQGALSVAVHSTRDQEIIESLYPRIEEQVDSEIPLVRRKLAGAPLLETVDTVPIPSGLLLRSQLVSGWPGLEVLAFESYTIGENEKLEGQDPIPLLRMDRLSPDVLLCFFAGTPSLVQLNEPKEGLSFGASSQMSILPRFLGYHEGQPVGEFVTGNPSPEDFAAVAMREGDTGVMDVLATRDNIVNVLERFNALETGTSTIGSADFAIELIKAAEQQSFLSNLESPSDKDCENY